MADTETVLETKKDVTLRGTSKIGGAEVVSMNATINQDGTSSNFNYTILNTSLYDANVVECREDIMDFLSKVQGVEDEMAGLRAN